MSRKAKARRRQDRASGSLNGARFLARCGGRDAGGVFSPTAAVPARVATGGRAPLVDTGTRRTCLSSDQAVRSGSLAAMVVLICLQSRRRVICRAGCHGPPDRYFRRRADSRRDRRAPGPDLARVRQPVVRSLPRRQTADRERARRASRSSPRQGRGRQRPAARPLVRRQLWPTLVFLADGREAAGLVRPRRAAAIDKALALIAPVA